MGTSKLGDGRETVDDVDNVETANRSEKTIAHLPEEPIGRFIITPPISHEKIRE